MHLLLLQFGMCAICGRGIDEVYCFVIDHCHRTGTIRGLLCNRCNDNVGAFENNNQRGIEWLRSQGYLAKIRAYVAEHRKLARPDDTLTA